MSEVIVLCYHAVSDSWDASVAVSTDQLESQLRHITRLGWRSASFKEAVLSPPYSQTMVITFDDAFRSVKELAFPILSKLGLTATVFAPTSYVTSGKPCLWPGLDSWAGTEHEHELLPMGWNELGELAGHSWEIGSHTCTHPHLTQLDDAAVTEELERSREDGLKHLGQRFDTIGYPYGDVDERVADVAEGAGYQAGAALSSRLTALGPMRFPRTGIYRRDASWRFRLKTTPVVLRMRASSRWAA